MLRWRYEGDEAAREELLARFLPLARRLARRYERMGESPDDLFQVASLGLLKAIERFEPSRGSAFSSYAVPTMLGELKRHFRDTAWAVHVPRGMQERVLRVSKTVNRLSVGGSRSPTPTEVATAIGAETEDVVEAMEAASAYDALSLDSRRRSEDGDGATYAETVGSEDERFDLIEHGLAIAPAFRALPERERHILHLRFEQDLTQSEIAERIGVSQMHVSRLIRRALDRLRAVAEGQERQLAG